MSKLKGLLQKVKVQTLSFEKHPCRELPQEMMMHYLNGLALIASADENICEKEKEYLEIIINSFGLSEEILETVVNFAENPDEDLIQDMMEAFATKDIKYNFMVDCMMISSRDGSFDDDEKGIIEEYFEMFKITQKEAEDLKYIFEIFHKQDGNALYRYFKRNEYMKIELFQYLLDYYKIDMAYELIEDEKKILEFEFFKPTFSSGTLGLGAEEIMTQAISNAQFCIFLNSAYMSKTIEIDGNGKVIDGISRNIVMDLSQSKITFDAGLFIVRNTTEEELKATGMTTVLVDYFINWINVKNNSEYVYYVTNTNGAYKIDMSSFTINLENEFLINRCKNCSYIEQDRWYCGKMEHLYLNLSNALRGSSLFLKMIESQQQQQQQSANSGLSPDMLSNDVSFRLMRIPK